MDTKVVGIGIDILAVARIQALVEKSGRRFLEKHFTQEEIHHCSQKANKYQRFAGKFAAKEAVFKALSLSRKEHFSWKDIQILNEKRGAPQVELGGAIAEKARSLGRFNIFVSISHCKEYAAAVVLITREGKDG
ncbi:MAG: holo-ACP synthase [Spirochaetota bacterium]